MSLLRQGLDGEVAYSYVWLDATFLKGHQQARAVAQAVVIAIGLNAVTCTVVHGTSWQRYRVHFVRNALALT